MIDVAIVVFYIAIIAAIGIMKGRSTNTAHSFALGPQAYPPIVFIIITFSTMVDGTDTLGIAGDIFSTGFVDYTKVKIKKTEDSPELSACALFWLS